MSVTTLPEILDVTSGFRNMWFNKNDPDTLYCDLRTNRQLKAASEAYGKGGRKYKAIVPTMAASYCFLPFKDASFMLINADPPHLYKLGKTSLFRLKYGGLEIGTWQLELKMMAGELWRVLAPGGTITLKWCDRDVPLMEVHSEVLKERFLAAGFCVSKKFTGPNYVCYLMNNYISCFLC